MRYYIDTCVWIDFIEGRTNIDLFTECILEDHTVILSYPLQKELGKYVHSEQLTMILALLSAKELIERVDVFEHDKKEALHLSAQRNIPFADALHAVLARNNDALLITRDKHFLKLRDICAIRLF
ncbi:MAG: PIN domain-containing protein [Candidatus Woesearchaeota archaeon]